MLTHLIMITDNAVIKPGKVKKITQHQVFNSKIKALCSQKLGFIKKQSTEMFTSAFRYTKFVKGRKQNCGVFFSYQNSNMHIRLVKFHLPEFFTLRHIELFIPSRTNTIGIKTHVFVIQFPTKLTEKYSSMSLTLWEEKSRKINKPFT